MKTSDFSKFGTRLATTTALVSLAFAYGARTTVRAGVCVPGGPGTHICGYGANAGTDVTQTIFFPNLNVTTQAGFGIDTYVSGGDALTLTGSGGLTFTDYNASTIIGYDRGISAANSSGGNLSVTTTGNVSGGNYGIRASNSAVGGSIYVGAVGTVSGTFGRGIHARTHSNSSDLTITAANVSAQGALAYGHAVFADHDGTVMSVLLRRVRYPAKTTKACI